MSDPVAATAARIGRAAERLAAHVVRTPFDATDAFAGDVDADVRCKLENRQTTGSFKLRGAMNRLLTLDEAARERGCVAASSGNHGAAVACAARELGVGNVIFVPEQTSAAKLELIRSFGGDVRFHGTDGLDTEQHARAFAAAEGAVYLSPYNDEEVIAGQGSCGVEMLEQCPDLDTVFVAVGGGGLIGGVGAWLKSQRPGVRVVGCQPAASAVMAHSIAAGHIVDEPSAPTLSDGTAGGIEAGSVTFALNQAVVDEFVTVSEADIAAAMRRYMAGSGDVIEGAAGVALAGLLACRESVRGQTVGVIVCGGNIARAVLERLGEL